MKDDIVDIFWVTPATIKLLKLICI